MKDLMEQLKELEAPSVDEIASMSEWKAEKGRTERSRKEKVYVETRSARKSAYTLLMQNAWQLLSSAGYSRYKSAGNSAYEAGHTDSPSDLQEANYAEHGIESPTGQRFKGGAYWYTDILAALESLDSDD